MYEANYLLNLNLLLLRVRRQPLLFPHSRRLQPKYPAAHALPMPSLTLDASPLYLYVYLHYDILPLFILYSMHIICSPLRMRMQYPPSFSLTFLFSMYEIYPLFLFTMPRYFPLASSTLNDWS